MLGSAQVCTIRFQPSIMFVSDLLKDAQKCLILFFKLHNCVVDYYFTIMYNFTVLLFCNVYFKESLKVRIFEREKNKTKI